MLLNQKRQQTCHLHYFADNRLFPICFSRDDIIRIIQKLYPNKANGHDKISIPIIRI